MPAVLNTPAVNYITSHVKPFNFGETWGKFSTVQKVMELATDEKSLTNSKTLIAKLTEIKDRLPTDHLKNIPDAQKMLKAINKDYAILDEFLCNINSYILKNNVELDDKNAAKTLDNLMTAKDILGFISDYLNFSLEIAHAKEEIKGKKAISFEELNSIICAG